MGVRTRAVLNILCRDINQTALTWDGREQIKIGGQNTTITKLAQDTLNQFDQYIRKEKSLKGRIETAQNLAKAFNQLKDSAPNPDIQTELITLIRKVNQALTLATKEQNDLRNLVDATAQREITDQFTDYPHTVEAKLNFAAFRSVKNVSPSDEGVIGYLGSWQKYAFFGLKKDLEQFLSSYAGSLTDSQKAQINDILPLLESGGELHSQILNLFNLDLIDGAPDNYIESQIADLAYEIEKSIDQLRVGQSILIPGGCSGHAILYQVQRVRENEFQFSLFNTGWGNEFGQLFFDNIPSNQFRVPLFQNLSKEAVSDRKFIIDLVRYKATVLPTSPEDVHSTIVKHLKDKHKAVQTVREPHDKQTWGTCSYDSVAAFLEYTLPPSLFRAFEYDMMLRARGELNSLLHQAKGIFPKKTLDFIDKKSCETVTDWKKKFDKYCDVSDRGLDDELYIAKRIIGEQQEKNEESIKNDIEYLQDIMAKDYPDYMNREEKAFVAGAFGGAIFPAGVLCASFTPLSLFACPVVLLGSLGTLGTFLTIDQQRTAEATLLYLSGLQKLLEIHSPEQSKILKDRNEDFGWHLRSGTNRVVVANLDFSRVFDHLNYRYQEIALCGSQLLNATLSPLKEAMRSCNVLPSP